MLDAASSVVALSKGMYDISTGIIAKSISSTRVNEKRYSEGIDKITTLYTMMKKTEEVGLFWDIASAITEDNTYIITSLDIDVQAIKEETGDTQMFKLRMKFEKTGHMVPVL